MGATPLEMYKLFFGSQAMCPDLTKDAGLRRIRTHYLWSEEQFVHLHGRHAKKMLENSWSLRVELPQAEGATFAGQSSANQHNLCHHD